MRKIVFVFSMLIAVSCFSDDGYIIIGDKDTHNDTDSIYTTGTDDIGCWQFGMTGVMNDGLEWRCLSGREFDMGSNEEFNEQPVHKVDISDYFILTTEVTVAEYAKCVFDGSCTRPNTNFEECNWDETGYENHPVNCVEWIQAVVFCAWAGGRLPSESEWEYAARSGGQDIIYPWGDENPTCDLAVLSDVEKGIGCGTGRTWEVCSKAGTTSQGLCDMAGNVFEWTRDLYYQNYNDAPIDGSPMMDGNSKNRVSRGGGFLHMVMGGLRTTYRHYGLETDYRTNLGFRCVKNNI